MIGMDKVIELDYKKEYEREKEHIFKINREKTKVKEQNKILLQTIKIILELENEDEIIQ